jgi:uncharacterized membrane protein YuzA (DUF378 family)
MEALAMIAAILVGLVGLDLISIVFGTDSRERTREQDRSWPIH